MNASQAPTLAARLALPKAILAPGVYDALTALVAQQAGFEAVYLSGASIAYSRLGRPDIGLTTSTEVAQSISQITDRVSIPLIVDGDTGFGNALNTQRTIREFERAGAAMIQIEDQTFPKRCGHLNGKGVISTQEMVGKLRAALDAREKSTTLLLARTDALAVEGLEPALERAERYIEAGVDALFIEALRTEDEMKLVSDRFAERIPMLANMVEGGKTPLKSSEALEKLGFRIVIFPGGTARAVVHCLQGYFSSLMLNGTTEPWREKMLDFEQLNQVIETPMLLEKGKKYDGSA
jgi:2-methylisocitrate lyase-like PEP mutase family enzyme